MKELRKTGNIMIRQTSKRTSKDQNNSSGVNKSKTSNNTTDNKKWIKNDLNMDLKVQKQLILAENLTQQQQQQIIKEAHKTVIKKTRNTQTKIENEMVSMLQQQCNKLGMDLEKQRHENIKLRIQVTQLRKNIEFLNIKLQNVFKDHQALSKNNDYGKMQKQQVKQQLQKLRIIIKRKQEQFDYHMQSLTSQIEKFKKDLANRDENIQSLLNENKNLRGEKQEIEQQLQQKTNEAMYLRQNFEQKKKQWDRLKQDFQSNSKQNLQKKGQKITKYQIQIQGVTDKLKQQQSFRKKLTQKNKELQKEILKKNDVIKELQEQISNLKKRVNDLSILKSSNNTIMNQKIVKLTQQNEKLKQLLQEAKGKKIYHAQQQKPYLFGPDEFD